MAAGSDAKVAARHAARSPACAPRTRAAATVIAARLETARAAPHACAASSRYAEAYSAGCDGAIKLLLFAASVDRSGGFPRAAGA